MKKIIDEEIDIDVSNKESYEGKGKFFLTYMQDNKIYQVFLTEEQQSVLDTFCAVLLDRKVLIDPANPICEVAFKRRGDIIGK